MCLKGNWRFDENKKQIKINLDQVQTDGSLFKMPIEIAIFYSGQNKPKIKKIQANAKSNAFWLNVADELENVIRDPNMWIFMDADFRKVE